MIKINRNDQRIIRASRSRSKMTSDSKRPRLVIFKSNLHIELQLVDDEAGKTLASVSTKNKACRTLKAQEKIEWLAGEMANIIKKANAKSVIYDRSGYKYHGNIARIAQIIRDQGIKI